MRLFTRRNLAAATMAAGFALGGATAEAAPISWDITYDPADVLMDNVTTACTGNTLTNAVSATSCQSLEFTFLLDGFNTSTDSLASGSLSLSFRDDSDPGPGPGGSHDEWVNISLDGLLTSGSPLQIPNGSLGFSTNVDVLAQLVDGQLTVLLSLPSESLGNNDFYFLSSRLTARGERNEQEEEPPNGSIPEPASLLLFGTAAMALAVRRRR